MTNERMRTGRRQALLTMVAVAALALGQPVFSTAYAADPFKLGVEERGYIQNQPMQGYADYPAPRMIPQQGRVGQSAPLQGGAQAGGRPLQAGVGTQAPVPPPRPPMQMGVQRQATLPPQFLGAWNVQGQRMKVEALPEFQQGAERAFAVNTSNVWQITGDPVNGYAMGSNTGVRTQLVVDKVEGNTAFIRYQHPIGNTMAQEAIVMTLMPGGAQFNGLERISIVKEGQPQPRARVTYQLQGYRQR